MLMDVVGFPRSSARSLHCLRAGIFREFRATSVGESRRHARGGVMDGGVHRGSSPKTIRARLRRGSVTGMLCLDFT